MNFEDLRRGQLVSVRGHEGKKWRVTDYSEQYHLVRVVLVGEGITWLDSLMVPAKKLELVEELESECTH